MPPLTKFGIINQCLFAINESECFYYAYRATFFGLKLSDNHKCSTEKCHRNLHLAELGKRPDSEHDFSDNLFFSDATDRRRTTVY